MLIFDRMEKVNAADIRIEEITAKDSKGLYDLMCNNRDLLLRYFPITVQHTRTVIGAEYYIQSVLKKRDNNEMIVLTLKYKNKIIGIFHIKNIDWRIPKCEIAYFLDKDFQGQGLASELLKTVINYCFDDLQMNKLFVRISPDNLASHKVAIKNGFISEGLLRKEFKTETGDLIDLEYLGLVNPKIM